MPEETAVTDFTGILKVTNQDAFAEVLRNGIGGGKFMGAGLVLI